MTRTTLTGLALVLGLAAPALAQTTGTTPGTTDPTMAPATGTTPMGTTSREAMGVPGGGTTAAQPGYPAQGNTGMTTMSPDNGMASQTGTMGSMDQSATAGTTPRAPDGTPAFGFEPYFGVLGGAHFFDNEPGFSSPASGRLNGELIEGVLGFNIPVGPVFIGAEGYAAKGFRDLDWEYGVRGRLGFRAGDSGLIYGSFGRGWVSTKNERGFADINDWVYGVGFEAGLADIGLGGVTGRAGPRLRVQVETYDFRSVRPMAGIVFHF